MNLTEFFEAFHQMLLDTGKPELAATWKDISEGRSSEELIEILQQPEHKALSYAFGQLLRLESEKINLKERAMRGRINNIEVMSGYASQQPDMAIVVLAIKLDNPRQREAIQKLQNNGVFQV